MGLERAAAYFGESGKTMTKLEQACQLLGDRVEYHHDINPDYCRFTWKDSPKKVQLDGNLAFALFDVVATWPQKNQDKFIVRLNVELPSREVEGIDETSGDSVTMHFPMLQKLTPEHVIDAAIEAKP